MAAAMTVVVMLLGGHRSPVIGQSMLAFQHHVVNGVNGVSQQAVKANKTISNHSKQDDRLLQAEAEGARARDDLLDDNEARTWHDCARKGECGHG